MGNFLDTPIIDKETDVGEDESKGLKYGLSAMQGWRAQMEDDHVQILSLPQVPDCSLFGVFDGHGGDMVAHYAARHFPDVLQNTKLIAPNMPHEDFVAASTKAFETALMQIDDDMLHLPQVESGQDQSGSTSVMTLMSPRYIVCANTGDSRAVLARAGQAVTLSNDHKPYLPEEKERIEKANGQVKFNRVNGDLAVSRALGDFVYKRCESVGAKEQAVTAFPEIIAEERHEADQFIVLACDGIWDVMSSQEVVDKVLDMLQNGRPAAGPEDSSMAGANEEDESEAPPKPPRQWDLGAVCEALIDHCLRLGSRDNMSVIIVLLQAGLHPKPSS
uniref:protein-serine/threonine phosphatase n=1 Tax=Haptolina ericina TaxID=156174 RepID=A0A7S3ERI7_9EUKA|mmetsp:Transcript_16532/g.37023  ORF Transcript_16532/g.37023 Transcript_16532/m.37023 type:complete len:332 (+) Transcript_16532:102-1097(+)|eukprot:CAMPEP_0181184622 /NCGR_PEP_ID=MMETSP1096-20121128/9066_1 /TAXON_ID=156174 ORGANISM="Chrysochromulina ericina, Strain CCMP281" /NCGR_SAMPLE_ID=MMETSP1096 /ASSEMBLY_ACC=CAM_ASM_000453 /LENGTH=331 /DNA_ID=CAMNT_0023273399 /DNA_START=94 /DNA_END=1089 /DNA_ORIENTATION=-